MDKINKLREQSAAIKAKNDEFIAELEYIYISAKCKKQSLEAANAKLDKEIGDALKAYTVEITAQLDTAIATGNVGATIDQLEYLDREILMRDHSRDSGYPYKTHQYIDKILDGLQDRKKIVTLYRLIHDSDFAKKKSPSIEIGGGIVNMDYPTNSVELAIYRKYGMGAIRELIGEGLLTVEAALANFDKLCVTAREYIWLVAGLTMHGIEAKVRIGDYVQQSGYLRISSIGN